MMLQLNPKKVALVRKFEEGMKFEEDEVDIVKEDVIGVLGKTKAILEHN